MPTVFPALDEEPPAPSLRSRFRRVALTLAAVVVLAGAGLGAWAAYGAVNGGSGAASGKVLAFNTLQQLVLANPDGSKPVVFSQLGIIGGHGAYVAPDGRALVTDAGDVVTLKDGRPVSHSTALYTALAGQGGYTCPGTVGACEANTGYISTQQPFADGSADVVFSFPHLLPNGNYTGASEVVLVAVGGGRLRGMGLAGDYAGDPQQPAVFAAVPSNPAQNPADNAVLFDTAIVHRVSGGSTTTVVTQAQVAHDLGATGNPKLVLSVAASPTGKTIAVGADTGTRDLGTAVYTRAGKLIGSTPAVENGPVSWSPSGARLIFSTADGIVAWTPGGATTRIPFPTGVASLQDCAWSPDGRQAACTGYPRTPNDQSSNYAPPPPEWVLVDVEHKSAKLCPAHGQPLLWEGS